MPNWCSNTMRVTGPKEILEAFVQRANGPTSSYNSFHGESWDAFDDVRISAIVSSMPEPGEVSELSFHALHPVPEQIQKLGFDDGVALKAAKVAGVDYPGMGGYGWQSVNWGTKWEASIGYCQATDNEAFYDFDTAWSPPIALYEHIAAEWPQLTFHVTWREEGMAFEGEAEYAEGDVVFFEENQIEWTDEEEYDE